MVATLHVLRPDGGVLEKVAYCGIDDPFVDIRELPNRPLHPNLEAVLCQSCVMTARRENATPGR